MIFFYSLLGLLFLAVFLVIPRIRNSNNRVDIKELAKSWGERMPQEIREHQEDKANTTTRNSQPIISDTAEVKIRDAGPETVKSVSRLEHSKEQFKLFTDCDEMESDLAKANNFNKEIHQEAQTNDTSLLQVYVCDSAGRLFDPEKLVSTLNIAGLTFGEMDIFHYYEADHTIPAFSAASMLEPGTFDIKKLQLVRTSGIVLFIGSESRESWGDDFRLMLNTAKRIATSLEAALYSAPEVLWTEEHEQKITEKLGLSSG
jgi:FtsZ-interacting cell division protein ZipA